MKTLFTYFTFATLFLLLTNCSSVFYTLTPDEESDLEMGRKIIEKEDENVYSSISFEEQTGEEFVFYLFAHNKSNEKILVDPGQVYIKVYDENKERIIGEKIYAMNPEEQIHQISGDIEEREDSHDLTTGLNIVFSLFDTIADLSDEDEDDAGEVAENVLIFTGNQISEEVSYKNDMDELKSLKSYWKNDVLRITEIDNEEEISGIFYIPIIEEAKYIKMYIPFGKSTHTYKFRQIENQK